MVFVPGQFTAIPCPAASFPGRNRKTCAYFRRSRVSCGPVVAASGSPERAGATEWAHLRLQGVYLDAALLRPVPPSYCFWKILALFPVIFLLLLFLLFLRRDLRVSALAWPEHSWDHHRLLREFREAVPRHFEPLALRDRPR